MNTDTLFSHNSDEWSTPSGIFTELDNEFHFNLDPCATAENYKCERYFDKQQDGLSQKWGGAESSAIHHIQRLEIG